MNKRKTFMKTPIWLSKTGFIGLFVAIVLVFLFLPLFTESFYVPLAFRTLFGLVIISTIFTISQQPIDILLGLIVSIPFMVFEFLSIRDDSLYLMMVAYSFYSVFLVYAIVILTKRMFEMALINTNLVFGAVTIYLLTGILWGKFYFLIETLHPTSFHGIQSLYKTSDLSIAFQNEFDLLYYSFGTLTTLGIGDITPSHHVAKSMTVLEAMFGQLFTATFIAKVVSIWRHHHPGQATSHEKS